MMRHALLALPVVLILVLLYKVGVTPYDWELWATIACIIAYEAIAYNVGTMDGVVMYLQLTDVEQADIQKIIKEHDAKVTRTNE